MACSIAFSEGGSKAFFKNGSTIPNFKLYKKVGHLTDKQTETILNQRIL